MFPKKSQKIRPQLLDLEQRITPAFNLAIDGDTGTNFVTSTVNGNVTTFEATATGATLDPIDIANALQTGDVIIDTGAGLLEEAGDITWAKDSNLDDLTLFGITQNRTLRFRTVDSDGTGNITISGDVSVSGINVLNIEFLSNRAAADGNIDVSGMEFSDVLSLNVNAGDTGTVTYANLSAENSINLTGQEIVSIGTSTVETTALNSTIVLNSPLTVSAAGTTFNTGGILGDPGTVTLTGGANGTGALSFSSTTITVGAEINLAAGSSITINRGNFIHGANDVTAPLIFVGPLLGNANATLGQGSGTVTGNVVVHAGGKLVPAGTGTGTLTILGNVEIDATGSYDPDIGDLLAITGDLTLDPAGTVLGGNGTGALPTGDTTLVTYTGTLAGTFSNAPLNTPFILGTNVAEITNYLNGTIIVAQATVPNAKSATGHDNDGTSYTAKLTGPGNILVLDGKTSPIFFLKDTTSKSALTITTKANGSNDILAASQLIVQGSLNSLTAAKTDFSTKISISGTAKTLTVRDAIGPITLAGAISDNATLKGRNFGKIQSGSSLAMVSATGKIGGDVSAPKIGTINAVTLGDFIGVSNVSTTGGAIGNVTILKSADANFNSAGAIGALKFGSGVGFGRSITAAGGITSLTVNELFDGNVTATSLGAFKAGFVQGGVFNVTGAIASLTTREGFNGKLTAGSVGPVKVGGVLSDFFAPNSSWNVTDSVTSITAGAIGGNFGTFTFSARNLDSLKVVGNSLLAFDVDADIKNAKFTLTGNNLKGNPIGNPAGFGLKTVSVAGNVTDSVFDLKNGSLMSFTAGRFINSKLYLDYTPSAIPGDPFDSTGDFDSAAQFKLGTFTLTASVLGTTTNPLNYPFSGSEIVADTLGKVRLSGLQTINANGAFGLKFRTAGGSVQFTSSDSTTLQSNSNLTPDNSGNPVALDNDFFFIDV